MHKIFTTKRINTTLIQGINTIISRVHQEGVEKFFGKNLKGGTKVKFTPLPRFFKKFKRKPEFSELAPPLARSTLVNPDYKN
jgi:hypothetical protein